MPYIRGSPCGGGWGSLGKGAHSSRGDSLRTVSKKNSSFVLLWPTSTPRTLKILIVSGCFYLGVSLPLETQPVKLPEFQNSLTCLVPLTSLFSWAHYLWITEMFLFSLWKQHCLFPLHCWIVPFYFHFLGYRVQYLWFILPRSVV